MFGVAETILDDSGLDQMWEHDLGFLGPRLRVAIDRFRSVCSGVLLHATSCMTVISHKS